MKLPICRKPYPDELYYGYIMDICLLNEISTLTQFKRTFYDTRFSIKPVFPTGLHYVCDTVENDYFPDVRQAMNMTPYRAFSFSANERTAARISESMLNLQLDSVMRFPVYRQADSLLHICPECWKNDIILHGQGYLHVMHHSLGIKVCPIHRIPLLEKPSPTADSKLTELDPDEFAPIQITDSDIQKAVSIPTTGKENPFLDKECPTCRKHYIVHPYSDLSGQGCPFCLVNQSAEDCLQRRLDALYPGEYRIKAASHKYSQIMVEHIPCGLRTKNYYPLIFDAHRSCKGCCASFASVIQKRLDPNMEHWVFFGTRVMIKDKYYIRARHVSCGKEYTFNVGNIIYYGKPMNCPFCITRQKISSIEESHPDYRIISEYHNGETPVTILHKECGYSFRTRRNAFFHQTRCPLCVPKMRFDKLVQIIREYCSEDYTMTTDGRGIATIRFPDGTTISRSYSVFLDDLMSSHPTIFVERKKRYVPSSAPLRLEILNSIHQSVLGKGFWTFSDGIDGRNISHRKAHQAIVWNLVRSGYIQHLGDGRFTNAQLD